MALSLDAIAALDAIERRGSFARAADELDRVPSAITYLVRKLEDDLDVLLFDRRGHKALLTPAGRELLDEGRHLLQAASELERRVRRIGDGWEVELRIAVDTVVRMDAVHALVAAFDRERAGTRLRFATEVLGGTWESLVTGRADLALGTFSPLPPGALGGSGFRSLSLGEAEFVFAVAPTHPLAAATEPLGPDVVRRHRAIAVADSARTSRAITVGLIGGQDVLTVPSMDAKVAAQVAGLGCGSLPLGMAKPFIESGRLVPKRLTEARLSGTLWCSWNAKSAGRALRWFVERLDDEAVRRSLLP